MNCPACPESTLVMADRSGVEIDYCPTCRGVWLDRGELDKIIERAPGAAPATAAVDSMTPQYARSNSKYHSKYHTPAYGRKKKNFLSEMFDF